MKIRFFFYFTLLCELIPQLKINSQNLGFRIPQQGCRSREIFLELHRFENKEGFGISFIIIGKVNQNQRIKNS